MNRVIIIKSLKISEYLTPFDHVSAFFLQLSFDHAVFRLTHFLFLLQNSAFLALLPQVRERIVDSFSPKALDIFQREFDFFDKVTSISGKLFPLPKDERRAGIRRYLVAFSLTILY